ncbi:MAG: ABC transporter ATP-binding protein [Phycisphaerae bacterium]|nr:ABC transporter ATP-binding protein [Phycisphaerae bacterium]
MDAATTITGPLVIETRGLTRRFGSRCAVDHIDLAVPRAGVYGFLGPNGAGKTTTIRMLLGLIRPDEGEVRLFGDRLEPNRLELLRRVGALVEMPSLYPHLSGRENLEVTRRLLDAPKDAIDRVLEIVKLVPHAPRRVREYSLGMRQRLGLALALLNRPSMLVLDEPVNGLDPAGIHEIRDLIRRLPREHGVTVFLSSHMLGEIEQLADRVGIVRDGRLVFQGELEELHARQRGALMVRAEPGARAVGVLRNANWQVDALADGTLSVVTAHAGDAADINQLLVQNGCRVYQLARARASLEEIFLNLTAAGGGEGA